MLYVFQEYQGHLSRIRSFLASTRSRSTLLECERLLTEARKCTTAMQAIAAIEGNAFRIEESKSLTRRDLIPLQNEIQRGLVFLSPMEAENLSYREEHFYQPPSSNSATQSLLIQTSDDLLRETQS
jgi:hypothetical protein